MQHHESVKELVKLIKKHATFIYIPVLDEYVKINKADLIERIKVQAEGHDMVWFPDHHISEGMLFIN